MLGSFLATASAEWVTYANHSVFRATVKQDTLSQMEEDNVDVWMARVNQDNNELRDIEFLLHQQLASHYADADTWQVVEKDYGEIIAAEKARLSVPTAYARSANMDDFFLDFQTYDDIVAYMQQLASTYPNLLEYLPSVGVTVDDHQIRGLKMATDFDTPKPSIHMEAQVHAREWLASPSLLWIVTEFCERYTAGDPEATNILDRFDFHIVPMVNVDGYLWTWSTARLWRKNRRNNGNNVFGVDLNRNWGPDSTHCSAGSSTNPSSDTYCGPNAFSEPEIASMRDYIENVIGDDFVAGIDFHTYGALILWPWQYTYDRIPESDYSFFDTIGARMQADMRAIDGQNWVSQQGSDLYAHSGGYVDYNYEANAGITFTFEGRGSNFSPPPSAIIPSGQEQFAGVVTMCHNL